MHGAKNLMNEFMFFVLSPISQLGAYFEKWQQLLFCMYLSLEETEVIGHCSIYTG